MPEAVLDEALALATAAADTPPVEALHNGSGWGALERRLRARDSDRSLDRPGTPFADQTSARRSGRGSTCSSTAG